MNTVVTSRQALLAASRTVARRQGLGGLSIRAVAAEARVSVGSVYNYFSGKTELLAAPEIRRKYAGPYQTII